MTGVQRARPADPQDRPRQVPFNRQRAEELGGSAIAALALIWALFHLLRLNAPLGFVLCSFAAFVTIYGIVVRQRHGAIEVKDNLATVVVGTAAFVGVLPLILILYYVVNRGSHAVFHDFPSFSFLRQDLAHFGERDPISRAGMKHAIIGTLEQVGLATAASVPIGVLTATYLNEIGGRFATLVRTVADAMTGLPSIIAGLFVYSAWVLPRGTKGSSGFAAAMALTVVMLPTIVRTAEEVLRLVSNSLREAALALGAPEWRTVLQVVIPTARTGLVTATILGIARAVGETAPVLLTAFGSQRTNANPFSGPQADLPLTIFGLVRSTGDNNVNVAWGGALILMVVILTLFTLARILGAGGPGKRRRSPLAVVARLRRTTSATGA